MSVLYDFVEQTELPLLHLLLFYSNHCYLGVLEFEQVEEYILFSVMGGAGFQVFQVFWFNITKIKMIKLLIKRDKAF